MQTIQNNGGPMRTNWTVRDEFAAKAMQGICSWGLPTYAKIAESAYEMADAMLAARANEQPVPREAYDQCNADLAKAEAKLEELGCCRCLNGEWVAPAAEVQS